MNLPDLQQDSAPQPSPTHDDHIECVVCARNLPGLLVRIATGLCTACERAYGIRRPGQ